MTSHYENGDRLRNWFEDLRSARENECEFVLEDGNKCGSAANLEFAHVKPTKIQGHNGRGKKNRYYDIKINPDCYKLWCREHHDRYDKEQRMMTTKQETPK